MHRRTNSSAFVFSSFQGTPRRPSDAINKAAPQRPLGRRPQWLGASSGKMLVSWGSQGGFHEKTADFSGRFENNAHQLNWWNFDLMGFDGDLAGFQRDLMIIQWDFMRSNGIYIRSFTGVCMGISIYNTPVNWDQMRICRQLDTVSTDFFMVKMMLRQ